MGEIAKTKKKFPLNNIMEKEDIKAAKPSSKKLESNQVRYTGDWSADSKLSAITYRYWEDPFFRFFNKTDPKKLRRTSLICRGYHVRFRVCDFFMRSILRTNDTPMQVVSLGCGMDTSFFRLLPELENKISAFYELDFKSVITAKKSIILHNEILRLMSVDKLFLLSCDLRKPQSLHETLESVHFDFNKPTLFYSECVVNYLRPNESNRILHYIAENVPNAVWLAYEQCYPYDAFGQIMVSHFIKNGCPLLSLLSTPNPHSQKEQLENAGFESCHIFNAWDSFVQIGNENPPHFPVINEPQQQFDEYSALIATCLHYTVRIGCIGSLSSINSFLLEFEEKINFKEQTEGQCLTQVFKIDENSLCNEEFSLTVNFPTNMPTLTGSTTIVCTNTNKILTFGGYGENSLRMKHLIESTMNFDSENNPFETDPVISSRIVSENALYYERIYSKAVYIPPTTGMDNSGNCVYIFGGRQSPKSPCKNNLICLNVGNIEECKEASSFISPTDSEGESKTSSQVRPDPRWRFGMVLYYQKGFPILVMFGGLNTEKVLGDCWWYSILKSEWTQHFDTDVNKQKNKTANDDHPSPRHSHAMVSDIFLGHMFIVGGVSADDTTLCTDAFWEFRWEWGCWKNIPQFNSVSRRIGHSLEIHKKKIYIVGGYPADSSYSLHHFITIIDLDSSVIKTYNYNFFPDSRFLPFGFSTCILNDAETKEPRIVIFGGGGNCFSFGTHFNKICAVLTLKCSTK